ncbi:MAG: ATP-dependent DNA helicase RecG [Gammaproteobacteria bacterium]|nr:ATP-dependent DNA helicase RecG [SAR86 cluster bacterium]GIT60273.1 MAG: ATP-dependent DNA helicase RecG [Gammaproteobacteria bacterium]|tara:strand:+ start:142 stop:2226 length:2085 start_codon:yes stop_codon:yes gene_type:complete
MPEGKEKNHPIQNIRGVGPKIADTLSNLGIYQVEDAVFHLPYKYEDRTNLTPIGDAPYETPLLVEGEIVKSTVVFRGRRMLITEIFDGTGRLTMRMFHFAFAQHKNLKEGHRIRCFGTIRHGPKGKEMIHPQYQVFSKDEEVEIEDHLTPIYPSTSNLQQGRLRKLIQGSIIYCQKNNLLKENWETEDEGGFKDLLSALTFIHNPPTETSLELLSSGQHPAQRKLIKEELVAHILCSGMLKRETELRKSPLMQSASRQENLLLGSLGFELTNAQTRVWDEIKQDFEKETPMRRLLQGDVGSGKTVIAALATLQASDNSLQTAFMCPTEILAEQHYENMTQWFTDLGIKVDLLLGSTKAKDRKRILSDLQSGKTQVLLGTHALFQKDVIFKSVGLTIIDEQHRFGVHQRFTLLEKGGDKEKSPHQLIMTATPIPRTLSMTVYGALDTSIIDELPPGRRPVETTSRPNSMRSKVIKRIEEVCLDGQRVYWVCTLIEDSDELEAQAAEELFKEISKEVPKVKTGLVHGRLKKEEKDKVINRFRKGDIQLLVCTTVIEVGVDVPEATLMIIENPERLGLAQLHQLRGRVGRKADTDSHCLLLFREPLSELAKERISTMENTNDGFVIAEKDLELRGGGDIHGLRQSGLMNLKIANPIRDSDLLESAQQEALLIAKTNELQARSLINRWIGARLDYSDS